MNISSGNTKSSNAFTLAAMLYKKIGHRITTYYAGYDYNKQKTDETNIKALPVFSIKTPSKEQCEVLQLLKLHPDGLTKNKILMLTNKEYAKSKKEEREYRTKELISFNRRIIDKLIIRWEMIRIEGKGKGARVTLTKEGIEFAEFL